MSQQWDSEAKRYLSSRVVFFLSVTSGKILLVRARVSFNHLECSGYLWDVLLDALLIWGIRKKSDGIKRASPSWRWSLRSSTCWLAHRSYWGLSVLYRAYQLLSCRVEVFVLIAIHRCLLFQGKELPRRLELLIDERVKSALFPALLGEALHKDGIVFCFELGLGFKVLLHDDSPSLLDDQWQHYEISYLSEGTKGCVIASSVITAQVLALLSSWQNVTLLGLWIHSKPSQREFFLRRNGRSGKPLVQGGSTSSLW